MERNNIDIELYVYKHWNEIHRYKSVCVEAPDDIHDGNPSSEQVISKLKKNDQDGTQGYDIM